MNWRRASMTLVILTMVGLVSAVNPDSSAAQVPPRVRVIVPAAPVRETAGSRSTTIMTALGGSVFEVLARDGDWYWIMLPPDTNGTSRPGYIGAENIEILSRAETQRPEAAATASAAVLGPDTSDASPDVRALSAQIESLRLQMQALQQARTVTSPAPRPIEATRQTSQPVSAEPDRGGFTMLLDLGAGIQKDVGLADSAAGLAGLNLGLGAFLTRDLALMFRFSGTTASYGSYSQVSGVAGPMIQYWVSDRFNVRAGGGLGFWTGDEVSDTGFGLILGAGVTVFNRGKHNLQIGVEYAPAFTEGKVHNIGFTFGYQLL